MLTSFSLSLFRFVLEPKDRLALHPRNPSNSLRGAFGTALKRLVCPTPGDCRESCRLKATCPYGQIFEPSPPPGSDRLRLNQDIPRPFVLRPPNRMQTVAEPGNPLTFELILIGSAIDYLPYFLVTFRELEQQGLGLGRGRYELKQVLQVNPFPIAHDPSSVIHTLEPIPADNGQRVTANGSLQIYSSNDQLVRPSPQRVTFDACRNLAQRLTVSGQQSADNGERLTHNGKRVTVRFLTPTHLKADGTIVTRPDFHHVIKRLRDRINALASFYCNDALDIDFKAFGERAEAIRTVSCRVRWEDRGRRSWKTGLAHSMGGFVGEATYEGDVEEFLPLLILGQYTHVGKYAVWGNGQYEVSVL